MVRRRNDVEKILVTPITATAGSVMPNFKAAEWGWICNLLFGLLLNMSAQFALPNGFEERAYFVSFADGHELDAAISQIADRAGDIEALGYLPDGVTEAYALDVSFIENLNRTDHALDRLIRRSAEGNPLSGFIARHPSLI